MIKRLNLVLDGWGRYFKCGYPERPFYDRIGIVALDMARAAGCRQSILSALRQDFLDEQTREYGVDGWGYRACCAPSEATPAGV